jgi:hypothetical protein
VVLHTEEITIQDNIYIWGIEWGGGNEIKMSIKDLFDKFLYKKNFIQHKRIYNYQQDVTLDYGNGNEYTFYKNCISVYHVYEGDESIGFLDWCGLKIIYQQDENTGLWYATGLIYVERIM